MRSDRCTPAASGSNNGRGGNTLNTMLSNRNFEYLVDAYVGNQKVTCLLDSGASASYMNTDFCKRFFPGIPIREPDPSERVSTANDSPITIDGSVTLFLRLGNYATEVMFILARDLRYDAILGVD